MEVKRCPECGQRLKTNYCDMCMRKVTFGGVKWGTRQEPWERRDASSAHRMEKDHTCISFEKEEKKTVAKPKPKQNQTAGKKVTSILAIIVALLSLLPSLFGVVQDLFESAPVPEPETMPLYEDIPQIESREVYNDGEIIVTVDHAAIYYDAYSVFMTVFNESEEDVVVYTDFLSVNGFMQQASFYGEVKAGEGIQEALQLNDWELEEDGITDIGEISFYLNIYQEDDNEMVTSELITIETELADELIPQENPDGWDLYLSDDLLIRLVSCEDNSGNVLMEFYLENKSEDDICIYAPVIYFDDQEVSSYLWENLRAGTRALCATYAGDSGDPMLSELETITIELMIEHMEKYEITDSRTEIITFAP